MELKYQIGDYVSTDIGDITISGVVDKISNDLTKDYMNIIYRIHPPNGKYIWCDEEKLYGFKAK